jgi:hypothetical protein
VFFHFSGLDIYYEVTVTLQQLCDNASIGRSIDIAMVSFVQ